MKHNDVISSSPSRLLALPLVGLLALDVKPSVGQKVERLDYSSRKITIILENSDSVCGKSNLGRIIHKVLEHCI